MSQIGALGRYVQVQQEAHDRAAGRQAEDLFFLVAEKFLGILIEKRNAAFVVKAQDNAIGVLHQIAIFGFASAQRFLSLPSGGNIPGRRMDARDAGEGHLLAAEFSCNGMPNLVLNFDLIGKGVTGLDAVEKTLVDF